MQNIGRANQIQIININGDNDVFVALSLDEDTRTDGTVDKSSILKDQISIAPRILQATSCIQLQQEFHTRTL